MGRKPNQTASQVQSYEFSPKAFRPKFFLQERLIEKVVFFAKQWNRSFFKHFLMQKFGFNWISKMAPAIPFLPRDTPPHVFFPQEAFSTHA